jgi:hypothetical protein
MFVYVQRFTLFAENSINMKNFCLFFLLALFLSFFSCVSVQPGKPVVIRRIPSAVNELPLEDYPEASSEVLSKEGLKVIPELLPEIPETGAIIKSGIFIMGKGRVDEEKLALFLVRNSPFAQVDFARIMAGLYIEEAAHEGIDHDVAFAQMCLETGFLTFGGLVQPEWNNFCGLGALGPEQPGLVFPDPRTGVRAHIQHLKAYATSEPLNLTLVDPRYRYVRTGSSPTIDGLAGTWAADKLYPEKIYGILQRLYAFAFLNSFQ